MHIKFKLAEFLAAQLDEKRLSREDFARLSRIPLSQVISLANGRSPWRAEHIAQVSATLGMPVQEFWTAAESFVPSLNPVASLRMRLRRRRRSGPASLGPKRQGGAA